MGPPSSDPDAFEALSFERRGRVAVARLNRPDKKNAINPQLRDELVATAELVDGDDELRVLVLAGAGDAFSAGADIVELRRRVDEQLDGAPDVDDALAFRPYRLASRDIDRMAKPVIAMIDGYCLGGGLELALACDIRVASARSTFGTPEINLGKFPGDGGTQRLPREANQGAAMWLVLTGQPIDAERAREFGIVQAVYADEALEAEAMALAETIAGHATTSLILAKRIVRLADRTDLDAGLDLEVLLNRFLEISPARREGLREFLGE